MTEIVDILKEAEYDVIEGGQAVLDILGFDKVQRKDWLCSGFGIFPNGEKCEGCSDCN